MSIKYSSRVLGLKLPPVQKLILMVLADAANENGISWPSLKYLAETASVSVRTAQRVLAQTEAQGLLKRGPRYRKDRSRTSSEYLLFPGDAGGDKLSCLAVAQPQEGVTATAVLGDTDVTLTTKEPVKNNNHHNHVVGLIFPRGLNPSVREAASKLLGPLSHSDAQVLLDELAGRLSTGGVRSSPVAYLRSLVKCLRSGDFVPELAHDIAEQRLQRLKECLPCESATPSRKISPELAKAHLAKIKLAIKPGDKS